MDFTLSLAHFCENDGPTTILCTQVLPVSCASCWPIASLSSSFRDLDVTPRDHPRDDQAGSNPAFSTRPDPIHIASSFDPDDLQEAMMAKAGSGTLVQSPEKTSGQRCHNKAEVEVAEERRIPASKALGDDGGCVSCSISLPNATISQLPVWAPGSPKKDGIGRNGSPIMRTTEKVFGHWSQNAESEAEDEPKFPQSSPTSFASDTSRSSCHSHEFIYRTTSSPIDPNTYAILRRATIRALSCEQLPRGLTSGALSFGDPVDGYTIAFKFRLPDPFARGCQRYYALLALAGQDSARMYKATPIIWRAFRRIAEGIMARTETVIVQSQTLENVRGGWKPAMPVSSFLTGRTVDPDGYPRRSGGSNVRARGLAEMVGDELIFAHVHGEFTYLLQNLGKQLGGMSVQPPTVDRDSNNVHAPDDSSEDGREN